MSKRIVGGAAVCLIVASVFVLWQSENEPVGKEIFDQTTDLPSSITVGLPIATSSIDTLGTSLEGRPITRYRFGTGSTTLLFVGGIHGGYEWNSSALAYEFITAFTNGDLIVPETITVSIIPVLNPDGLFAATGIEGMFAVNDVPPSDTHTTGKGRFNANNVDLNRNFDCKWQPQSTWRNMPVSAGTSAFSEPEAAALRQLIATEPPAAAVFWHSQGGAVYGSACEAGILPETIKLMELYAREATYEAIPLFDAYPISGDAEGWLASIGIPAITVELATRTTTERERNEEAVTAVLTYYAQ